MKVSSREAIIALLDIAISLAELLNRQLDDWETFMKDSLCCNIQVSTGAPRLP